MADASYWDHRALEPAPTAHRLRLGDRSALFCARRQQLYELNPTADAIWLAVSEHRTPAAAAQALDTPEALDFVRQAAWAWLQGGQLVPAEVLSLAAAPDAELHLAIGDLRLSIRTAGDADMTAVRAVFGQFASDEPGPPLTVVGYGGLFFILNDQEPLGAYDAWSWIPELKARITERYSKAVRNGFLAHTALLSRDGEGLLLCAEPGGGKSTLAVALAARGYAYHADDIVQIDAKGQATGVPFSTASKSGAWPLVAGIVPGLDALPVYLRADGQEVRYLPMSAAPQDPIPIGAVLVLDRSDEGPARIEPLKPMEALTTILGSAYSSRGAIDSGTMTALAAALDKARTGRLRYAALDEAVDAIDAFLR